MYMKAFLLGIVLCTNVIVGQPLIFNDDVSLKNRSNYIDLCKDYLKSLFPKSSSSEDERSKVCDCIIGQIPSNISSKEYTRAFYESEYGELFLKGKNADITIGCLKEYVLKACIETKMKDDEDYHWEKSIAKDYCDCAIGKTLEMIDKNKNNTSFYYSRVSTYQDILKPCFYSKILDDLFINTCVTELLSTKESEWNKKQATEYCSCLLDQNRRVNTTNHYSKLEEIDLDEIVDECIPNDMINTDVKYASNIYVRDHIIGDADSIVIPLKLLNRNMFKVKFTIGNIEKSYLFDTGASDCIISNDVYKELIASNTLTINSKIGDKDYSLADGSTTTCDYITIGPVKFGSYVLKSINLSVCENGSSIVGMSLLGKFSKWNLYKEVPSIVVFK